MNFLAHIYLSGPNDLVKLGNFTADFVKGNLNGPRLAHLLPAFKLGMVLHRQIDSYTDNHPVVRQSIDRLQPRFHKYAGVAVDMCYDHFLARHWATYASVPLVGFTQSFYDLLERQRSLLPPKSHRMVDAMVKRDWLSNYAHLEGLDWALRGIASRTAFESGLEHAVEALVLDYALYEQEFTQFFPEIISFCQAFLSSHHQQPISVVTQ